MENFKNTKELMDWINTPEGKKSMDESFEKFARKLEIEEAYNRLRYVGITEDKELEALKKLLLFPIKNYCLVQDLKSYCNSCGLYEFTICEDITKIFNTYLGNDWGELELIDAEMGCLLTVKLTWKNRSLPELVYFADACDIIKI